jgi:predicted permease
VKLNGEFHEIVGVMPPGFTFPDAADVWTVTEVKPYQGGNSFIRPVIGRLKPDVTLQQAQADFEALTRPPKSTPTDWRAIVFPLKDWIVGDVRRPLIVLTAAVGFVFLVACVNVANLFLIRMSERRRELAVRAALGAGRLRLVQQLLAESLVLAGLAAGAGVMLATIGVPALLALAPAGAVPRTDLIRIDRDVLVFTGLVSLAATLFFGVLPALRASRSLGRSGSASRTTTEGREGLHGALVVAEIAASLVLLAGAGLMVKSFLTLRDVDTGFDPVNVVTATVDLPAASYATPDAAHQFLGDALAGLERLPAIEHVGAINWLPFGDTTISGDFALEGGRAPSPGFNVDKLATSADYFRAMGIRVVRGREFTDADGPGAQPVAIVSESAARSLWPGEEPIGKRISLQTPARSEADWLTVVGVVGDVHQETLTGGGSRAVYQSYRQVDKMAFLERATFVIRPTEGPAVLASDLRAVLRQADADLPAPTLVPMAARLATQTASPAFQARVLSIFATGALALTIAGIYGVLAFSVARRAREFGIRMALGAGAGRLVRLVVWKTIRLAAVGIALGSAGALLLTRVLEPHLYGVATDDPGTLLGVVSVVSAAVLAAAAIPVWRAAHVDPTVVLNVE